MTLHTHDKTVVAYDIRQDAELLGQIRIGTLSQGDLGMSAENGVVGSPEWWAAVGSGKVPTKVFEGVILRVDGGPMGDSSIVRIQGDREMKSWVAWNGFKPAMIGQHVEVRYAQVPPKKAPKTGYLVDLVLEVRVVA